MRECGTLVLEHPDTPGRQVEGLLFRNREPPNTPATPMTDNMRVRTYLETGTDDSVGAILAETQP